MNLKVVIFLLIVCLSIEQQVTGQQGTTAYYHERDASIENVSDTVTLHGTLTLPFGTGPYACAILISGSGPQNRDEELLGHKPFRVIADLLTQAGMAVLRYDDRGFGESTGNFNTSTSQDFTKDALAAMTWAKSQKEIDPNRIGFIGHSEGGMIAAAAAQATNAAFVISLAGTGVTGSKVLWQQNYDIVLAQTGIREEAEKAMILVGRLTEVLVNAEDPLVREQAISEFVDQQAGAMRDQLPDYEKMKAEQIKQLNGPWMLHFLAYDPATAWEKVKCPVLAMNGEKDTQVNASVNLAAISAALEKSGNYNYKTLLLPGLNHLFQNCTTGAPSEYAFIEEDFSTDALQYMIGWLRAQNMIHQ